MSTKSSNLNSMQTILPTPKCPPFGFEKDLADMDARMASIGKKIYSGESSGAGKSLNAAKQEPLVVRVSESRPDSPETVRLHEMMERACLLTMASPSKVVRVDEFSDVTQENCFRWLSERMIGLERKDLKLGLQAFQDIMEEQIEDLKMPVAYLNYLHEGIERGSVRLLETLRMEVALAKWQMAVSELELRVDPIPKEMPTQENMKLAQLLTEGIEDDNIRNYLKSTLEKLPIPREVSEEIKRTLPDYLNAENETHTDDFAIDLQANGFPELLKSKGSSDRCFELYQEFISNVKGRLSLTDLGHVILDGELDHLRTVWDLENLEKVSFLAGCKNLSIQSYYEAELYHGIVASLKEELSDCELSDCENGYPKICDRFDAMSFSKQKKLLSHMYADSEFMDKYSDLITCLCSFEDVSVNPIYDLMEGIIEGPCPIEDENQLLYFVLNSFLDLTESDLSRIFDRHGRDVEEISGVEGWILVNGMNAPLSRALLDNGFIDRHGKVIINFDERNTINMLSEFLMQQKVFLNSFSRKLPISASTVLFKNNSDTSIVNALGSVNEDLGKNKYSLEQIKGFIEKSAESDEGFSYYLKHLGVGPTEGQPLEKTYSLYRYWTGQTLNGLVSLVNKLPTEVPPTIKKLFAYPDILNRYQTRQALESAVHFNDWTKANELTDQIIYTVYQASLFEVRKNVTDLREDSAARAKLLISQARPGNRKPAEMLKSAEGELDQLGLSEEQKQQLTKKLQEKQVSIEEELNRSQANLGWLLSTPLASTLPDEKLLAATTPYKIYELYEPTLNSLCKALKREAKELDMGSFYNELVEKTYYQNNTAFWEWMCQKVAYTRFKKILAGLPVGQTTAQLRLTDMDENRSLDDKINKQLSLLKKNQNIPEREDLINALEWKYLINKMNPEGA